MTDITGLLEKSKKGKRFHCSVLIPNNFHFSIKSERLIVENPSFFFISVLIEKETKIFKGKIILNKSI